jgi:hypothetical protein
MFAKPFAKLSFTFIQDLLSQSIRTTRRLFTIDRQQRLQNYTYSAEIFASDGSSDQKLSSVEKITQVMSLNFEMER